MPLNQQQIDKIVEISHHEKLAKQKITEALELALALSIEVLNQKAYDQDLEAFAYQISELYQGARQRGWRNR